MAIKDNILIDKIKHLIEEELILSSSEGKPFFGKITLIFNDGKLNHLEKYETIK